MTNDLKEKPAVWNRAPLAEVVTFTKRPRGLELTPTVPFLPMALISATDVDISRYETREATKAKSGTYFEQGNLLVARITPCFENGKLGIVRNVPGGWGLATTEVYAVASEVLDLRYLGLYLRLAFVRAELIGRMEGATGRMRLPQRALQELDVAFPDLDAQRDLVARVESLFGQVDEGTTRFRRASSAQSQFRASVVVAALRGELLDPAREHETAETLLEAALQARRDTWEQEQGSARPGSRPTSATRTSKYPDPIPPSPPAGFKLPTGWAWASLDQLAVAVNYGTSAKTSGDASGVPVLRMGNIFDGQVVYGELKYLPVDHQEFPALFVADGDVLFNRTNSPELVGKAAVVRGAPTPCSFASYLIRVRVAPGIEPEWLAYFINSSFGRAWIRSVVTQQVGQANVNGTKLRALTVPLPPLSVQRAVRSAAEHLLAASYRSQHELDACVSEAERLRQAILSDALAPAVAGSPA